LLRVLTQEFDVTAQWDRGEPKLSLAETARPKLRTKSDREDFRFDTKEPSEEKMSQLMDDDERPQEN
jgi:hypothetical protein